MTVGGFPHSEILGSKPCWRLPEHIAASNVLHRSCLPSIHHTPLQATHTTKVHGRKIPLANSQTTNHHTKNDHKTIETNNRVRFEINSKTKIQKLLFCSRPLSSSQATTHRHAIAPAHGRPPGTTGIESRQAKSLGWRSGSPKAHPYHPAPTARPAGKANDVFHTSNPAAIAPCDARGAHRRTNIRLNSP